jgi:hypothetical protein
MFISGLPLSTFNPSMRGIIAILLAFTVALPIVARADIVGRASVIDGDTIEISALGSAANCASTLSVMIDAPAPQNRSDPRSLRAESPAHCGLI